MGRCRGAGDAAMWEPGLGRGGGRGGGWRHRHWATGLPGWERGGWFGGDVAYPRSGPAERDLVALKRYAEDLEQTLDDLKTRIQQIEEQAPVEPGDTEK